jgi:hypothetical protein
VATQHKQRNGDEKAVTELEAERGAILKRGVTAEGLQRLNKSSAGPKLGVLEQMRNGRSGAGSWPSAKDIRESGFSQRSVELTFLIIFLPNEQEVAFQL